MFNKHQNNWKKNQRNKFRVKILIQKLRKNQHKKPKNKLNPLS